MVLTVYCWLVRLYPGCYRDEFGEEMMSVFRDARSGLPPALAAKVSFYGREFSGLLSGALRARFDRLFGPATPSGRFDIQAHSRFRLSTVFLMLAMFAGVVLAIAKAASVAGDTSGLASQTLASVLVFMLLAMCAAAAVAWRILHSLRRSGVYRLENVESCTDSVELNGNR